MDYSVLPPYYVSYMSEFLPKDVTPVPGKFNIHFNKESSKLEYRLGGELVMDRLYDFLDWGNNSDTCPRRLPAHPVVSMDGMRLYFVDTDEPNKVKMMDTNKNVSVVYTAPQRENFIAYIAVNKKNDLAYTILDKNPIDCQRQENDPWAEVTGYHLINGKTYKIYDGRKLISFEGIIEFGDNYFITASDANGLGRGFIGPSLYRINGSNVELVRTFGSAVYRGRNYLIIHGDSFSPPAYSQSVLKVNLDDGSIETILSQDMVGREIFIFVGDTVVYPDGRIEFKYTDKPSDLDEYGDPSKREEVLNRALTFVYKPD